MIDRFGQRLDRFFDDGPSGGTSDGLSAALARTRAVNQRRGFGHGRVGFGSVRLSLRATVAFALLAMSIAALAVAGARFLEPAPRHESILLSVDEVLARLDPLDPTSTAVAVVDPAEHIEYPSYSPDGSKVAYWSAATFNSPVDLVVADADMTDRHILPAARTFRSPTPIAWSPDGTRLAIEGNDPAGLGQVYIIGVDGTGRLAIPTGMDVRGPAWSSDGAWIAVLGRDWVYEDTVGIYLVHPDGTGLHGILVSHTLDWWGRNLSAMSWSPDDREIAFTWYGDDTFRDGAPFATTSTIVAVIDVATGTLRALTTGFTDVEPTWSPDGARIAFIRGGVGEVMTIRPDGTDIKNIVLGAKSGTMTWSPDGSRMAVVAGDGDHLVIASMDGTVVRETGITDVVTRPTWTSVP